MRVVMMVGTHNTIDVAVECQVHMGVVLASSGRVDVGTCEMLLVYEEPHHMYQVW